MNNKLLLFLVGGLFLFILIAGVVGLLLFSKKANNSANLTYWGLWESEAIMRTVIDDYQRLHPNISIKYQKQSPINYRERLDAALKTANGPDLFRIHNTWVPMFKPQLAPAPSDVFTSANFRNTFYPSAYLDLVVGGRPLAVPLETENLVLFVNEDMFRERNLSYPKSWDEFRDAAKKLTVSSNGRITRAGAAMGAANNIDHWQDILSLMMLQAGVDINKDSNSEAAQKALQFYTTFLSVDRVWDETIDQSTLAFAQGKVAMYFAPSWRYFDIKELSKDSFSFRIIAVPQLVPSDPVNFATYWVEAVNKNSKNSKEAFNFLKYLSSKEVLTKLYAAQASSRGFGEPYPRVDMAGLLKDDLNAGVVVAQAPSAQSTYLASFTRDGDTGINSRVGKYFLDAVNAVRRGGDAKGPLETVKAGLDTVLPTYGIQ